MIHKVDVAIVTIYQAPDATADLVDIACDVYDEAYAKDVAKSGTMVELETNTGRYYHSWTPDAAGAWSVQIASASLGGKATKTYTVKTADEFGIVTALATVDGNVDDIETILGTPANFMADVSGVATAAALTTVDNEIATIDGEVGAIQTDLDNVTDGLGALKTAIGLNATPTEVATELATYDGPTKAELDVLGTAALATGAALTTVDSEVGAIQTDLDNGTDGLGAIKDAVDAIGSPAMVG